ncbi:MAG: arginase family protein [Kiloniellales bacterium]
MSIEKRFSAAIARAAKSSSRLDRRVLRILHGDVPTFMEAPLYHEVEQPDVVVVGLPYEGVKIKDRFTFVPATATLQEAIYARTGADQAPDEIRRNSVYYSLDHSGGLFPERGRGFRLVDAITMCDAGNLPVDHGVPAEETLHAASDRIVELIGEAGVPIILGGDDTVPYVGVRSVARQRRARLSVIKLDSHFDLSWEPRYWAGSQWARCMEAGYLESENLAIIGIRGLRNPVMWHEIAEELGIRYWTLQDVEENGIAACVSEAVEAVTTGTDYLYLSLDLDVIDPAFLPAQKYPDPAGLTAREALRALRLAVDLGPPLAGFDMACLGPAFDVNGLGAQLAARSAVEVIGGHAYRLAKGK